MGVLSRRGREKINLVVLISFGRDAVLRVGQGFPIADARPRVPAFEFFHGSPG